MAWGLLLALCGGLLAPVLAEGHHRLAVQVTAMMDETGTHRFTMAALLDGVRVAHYSRDTREVRPTQAWVTQAVGAEYLREKTQQFWVHDVRSKFDIQGWMHLHNQTGGFHTEQVHVGCALSDQTPVDPHYQYAYDGQDFISFDNQTVTWVAAVPPAVLQKQLWDTVHQDFTQIVWQYLTHECVWTLRSLVQQGRAVLERQVPPEVSVSRRDAPHGPVTLSCRASGFHPRPIHLSWVRDGGDVLAETSSSGILPLADGTYHTQSSLEIGPRPDGPRYACRVEHSSLTAPALVWAPEKGPLSPGVLSIIVLLVLVLAGVAGAGVWLWRRKSAGRRKPGYTPAATKTGDDSASSSASGTGSQSAGSRI
ncbi:class I histocompatibility antigen, F10 alpha chain-like [Pelodiscus sinensis]|uniref:class I histocompatibility antigen, F10 alpha chain-like n=1 Tax=Pelodiscus sinensis TaxID=13735 RepID=UPI003F6B9371